MPEEQQQYAVQHQPSHEQHLEARPQMTCYGGPPDGAWLLGHPDPLGRVLVAAAAEERGSASSLARLHLTEQCIYSWAGAQAVRG